MRDTFEVGERAISEPEGKVAGAALHDHPQNLSQISDIMQLVAFS
jgi:hypothetical protein